MWSRVIPGVLLASAQLPVGGGPSGRIGGFGEGVDAFGRLVRDHPAETLFFGGLLLLFLWLIRNFGSG